MKFLGQIWLTELYQQFQRFNLKSKTYRNFPTITIAQNQSGTINGQRRN
ncbi:hypothetical protein D1BOALGB6SA_570 [Olavius sp. associated proteobacterium Delta 1]|nr:hypothetical protein D1BOALGB6SA_570 [Olavius sp. associated proteobacterium Delta 1]